MSNAPTKLSPEQKARFLKFKADISKQEAERGDFWTFKDGETRIGRFNPDKQEFPVDITNKKGEVVASGMYRFWAKELIEDEQGNKSWSDKEKRWEIKPTWAKKVFTRFAEGHFDLRITREGSGQNDTEYDIIPYFG